RTARRVAAPATPSGLPASYPSSDSNRCADAMVAESTTAAGLATTGGGAVETETGGAAGVGGATLAGLAQAARMASSKTAADRRCMTVVMRPRGYWRAAPP